MAKTADWMDESHPNEDVVHYRPSRPNYPVYLSTHESMYSFGEAALRRAKRFGSQKGTTFWSGGLSPEGVRHLAEMAMGNGWHDAMPEVLDLAESAVQTMMAEHEIDSFHPVYDVSGGEVDVALYLTGDPEHMIDYPLGKVSKMGKVVSLICSTDAMASVGSEAFKLRGQVLTALAMALTQLGHATEFWVDMGATFQRGEYHSRILVKGVNDQIDPAMLLLAYCHDGMLRYLQYACEDGNPVSRETSAGGRGSSAPVFTEGLPEDMIVIPNPAYGLNDPHDELVRYLKLMGLIS